MPDWGRSNCRSCQPPTTGSPTGDARAPPPPPSPPPSPPLTPAAASPAAAPTPLPPPPPAARSARRSMAPIPLRTLVPANGHAMPLTAETVAAAPTTATLVAAPCRLPPIAHCGPAAAASWLARMHRTQAHHARGREVGVVPPVPWATAGQPPTQGPDHRPPHDPKRVCDDEVCPRGTRAAAAVDCVWRGWRGMGSTARGLMYETGGGRCLTAIRGGRSLVAAARKWYTVFRKTYGRMYYNTN